MDVETAFNIFAVKVGREMRIPFSIEVDPKREKLVKSEMPNPEAIKMINEIAEKIRPEYE